MQIERQKHGALRWIARTLNGCEPELLVPIFRQYGGSVRFNAGTYAVRLCRITATCTAGEIGAVQAWLRKATDFLSTEE